MTHQMSLTSYIKKWIQDPLSDSLGVTMPLPKEWQPLYYATINHMIFSYEPRILTYSCIDNRSDIPIECPMGVFRVSLLTLQYLYHTYVNFVLYRASNIFSLTILDIALLQSSSLLYKKSTWTDFASSLIMENDMGSVSIQHISVKLLRAEAT